MYIEIATVHKHTVIDLLRHRHPPKSLEDIQLVGWASHRLPDRLRLTGGCHGWFLAPRSARSLLPYGPWAAGGRECRRLADEDPDKRNRPTSIPRQDGRQPIA